MRITVTNIENKGLRGNEHLDISMSVQDCNGITDTGARIWIREISRFQNNANPLLYDFLIMASSVYGIDRTFCRKKYSVDGWAREFQVTFRLVHSDDFNSCKERIEKLLSFLTGDYWSCEFETVAQYGLLNLPQDPRLANLTQVNLFSGGMDSLIGAIDYMESHPQNLLYLASHNDSMMGGPKIDQERLVEAFAIQYPNKHLYYGPVRIDPKRSKEQTCRSRSLMFLAIGAIVADFANVDLVVPENGPVSLNYPLSPSRRAACSTRTTHPLLLLGVQQLFQELGINLQLYNPYEFKTKGEMVQECDNLTFLLQILYRSNSCGKRNTHQHMIDNHNATHCGRCMPCMYRKASLIGFNDATTYGITMPHLFQKRGNKMSNDFYAMLNYLKKPLTDEEIRKELRITGMGGINNFEDYVQLVQRTRAELVRLVHLEGDDAILQYLGI